MKKFILLGLIFCLAASLALAQQDNDTATIQSPSPNPIPSLNTTNTASTNMTTGMQPVPLPEMKNLKALVPNVAARGIPPVISPSSLPTAIAPASNDTTTRISTTPVSVPAENQTTAMPGAAPITGTNATVVTPETVSPEMNVTTETPAATSLNTTSVTTPAPAVSTGAATPAAVVPLAPEPTGQYFTLRGVIIDTKSAVSKKTEDLPEFVKTYTKQQALMPEGVDSGYSIFAGGRVYKFDRKSSTKIALFLKNFRSMLQVEAQVERRGNELSLLSIYNQE